MMGLIPQSLGSILSPRPLGYSAENVALCRVVLSPGLAQGGHQDVAPSVLLGQTFNTRRPPAVRTVSVPLIHVHAERPALPVWSPARRSRALARLGDATLPVT